MMHVSTCLSKERLQKARCACSLCLTLQKENAWSMVTLAERNLGSSCLKAVFVETT